MEHKTDTGMDAAGTAVGGAGGLRDLELDLLLDGVHRRYGYDFRQYARSSLTRRIRAMLADTGIPTISGLQDAVLHEPDVMERLLVRLSVNTSSFFRDPPTFAVLRNTVVPRLKTYPSVRIWCAGCGGGEELYSLAIACREEGVYDRTRIYATDMNEAVLKRAQKGVFPLKRMQEYTRNYHAGGGKDDFSRYYTAKYDDAIFDTSLKERTLFAPHNLVSDAAFNEFNLIMCRNVMIYFNQELQKHVHTLLYESLPVFGYLGLGRGESIKFTPYESRYEEVAPGSRIYRKIR